MKMQSKAFRVAASALFFFALFARLLFPGSAAYIRQFLGADALERAVFAFSEAASGSDSLGEAIAVFCEALDDAA